MEKLDKLEQLEAKITNMVLGHKADLQCQLKDLRDLASPFAIEELQNQVQGLNSRTLTLNDRLSRLEDIFSQKDKLEIKEPKGKK